MRIAAVVLAVGLALGAFVVFRGLGHARTSEELAFAALNGTGGNAAKALDYYSRAVQDDPVNPFKWSDLASALALNGDLPKARYCLQRALDLGGTNPQIWLRDANFHFEHDEPLEGLQSSARVVKTVPDYDQVLFVFFDQLIADPAKALAVLDGDRRAVQAYTRHLFEVRDLDGSIYAWKFAFSRGLADDALSSSYIDVLLRGKRYDEAQRDWTRFTKQRDLKLVSANNLVYNGGFDSPLTGCAFDWTIQRSEDFETAMDSTSVHDGEKALHIHFHGASNVSYKNVSQIVRVLPGPYHVTVWERWAGITTNEGPRIEIADSESGRILARSEPVAGNHDWVVHRIGFTAGPGTNLVAIRIVRDPSPKFDNKINGDYWLDSVQLIRQ